MEPCCIRVSKFGEHWSSATAQARVHGIDLVELLVQSPEFLGMVEPGTAMPRAAAVVPQSASNRVLAAVDERGGVCLVGCPDKRIEGSSAGIISDILAVNGRLWHQKYPVLAALFNEALGMPLADWVSNRVGAGFSAAAFQSGVEACLAKGRFPIVLVVSEFDAPAREMLSYLRNMNLDVRPLGYDLYRGDGVEVVRPQLFPEDRPKLEPTEKQAEPAPREPEPAPTAAAAPEPKRIEVVRTPPGRMPSKSASEPPVHREEYAQLASVFASRRQEKVTPDEPFPDQNASQKQREILVKLLALDGLGLKRKGFEYFPPKAQGKAASEGTIVIAVDPDRWPFPTKDEVVVVVNTSLEFLSGYLNIPSREIEEFLGTLPRVERKEHKGCLLLRAGNISEAMQLANELKALKEVAAGGLG